MRTATKALTHREVSVAAENDAEKLAALFYRLSLNSDFQVFRAWLRLTSTEVVLTAEASESALRMLEGRRQVPADIDRMIERGRRESAAGK